MHDKGRYSFGRSDDPRSRTRSSFVVGGVLLLLRRYRGGGGGGAGAVVVAEAAGIGGGSQRRRTTLLRAKRSDDNRDDVGGGVDDDDDTIGTEKQPTTTRASSVSSSSSNSLVLGIGLGLLSLVTTAAEFGILPAGTAGYGSSSQPLRYYTDEMIARDVGATLLTAVLGYAFVKVVTRAVGAVVGAAEEEEAGEDVAAAPPPPTATGAIESRDARKIIHTISAPAFMVFWPLFSNNAGSRAFAVIVPILNAVRLFLAGTSSTATVGTGDDGGGSSNKRSDESELARAVSRSGDVQEALGGPFIYVLILAANVLLFWRSSPVGIVSLAVMAAGDGMADLVGRRYGKNNQWPGLSKSLAGTLAFWVASTVASLALLLWMQYWGCLTLVSSSVSNLAVRCATVALIASIIELIPIADDNYTVPISAAFLAMLLLQ